MSSVQVYVYDLSFGLARTMSQGILGKQIDGVWHTGIVVFGQEYFFGGTTGVETCPPVSKKKYSIHGEGKFALNSIKLNGGTVLGQPGQKIDLGKTEIPYDIFMDYLREVSQTTFRAETYHLFKHNCNNFSSELAQFLTGKDIPSHITSLPEDILSTPFGAMIQPFMDAMQVGGGHSPFSDNPGQGPAR